MVLAPGITTPLDTVAEGAGPVSPTLDGAGQEPYGPLNTVLLGVLGRLGTHQAGDPRAITEAFRQSIALGETFAGEGHSASSLIHVFLTLRDRLARLLPPNLPAEAPWVSEWQQRLDRAVDNFLKVALQAFERRRVA